MAQVNFRIDDNLKLRAESVCEDMGMSMTTALTIFLVKLANERRIPFEITADPFYSKTNIKELERRVSNIESGKSVMKEHDLIEED
ncbi:MAG: type II toxin-antitoxin system RelB/DinJ family antitoxin [Lachnospiraceae bacterium]|nr:type II toxin-antitoxin system RelB/DinJ family antitoxin [Lachnospiraceae bacterium]